MDDREQDSQPNPTPESHTPDPNTPAMPPTNGGGTTQGAPSPTSTLPKLTAKQRRFYEAWKANGFTNATEAARECGVRARREGLLRDKASALSAHPAIKAHRDAYWDRQAMPEGELLADLAATARLDPATIGECYVVARKCCGMPAAGESDGPDAPVCRCAHPAESVRRFDWARAQALGVSRLVKHVALDRQGNETAEWYDRMAAIGQLVKVYGMASDATNVQVNVSTLSIEELRAIAEG